jgi:hypothetical protein
MSAQILRNEFGVTASAELNLIGYQKVFIFSGSGLWNDNTI